MKWKVFIVTHKDIFEEHYVNDKNFNNENWGFINVSNRKLENKDLYDKYDIIDMVEMPNFKALGPWWAETEAIYNIYLNKVYQNYDFIGFIHYDYELKDEFGNTNITEMIDRTLKENDLIYFSTFAWDYFQFVMADIRYPNQVVGNGLNCYDYILNDYNNFFGKSENPNSWMTADRNNMCSAFMCSKNDFELLMSFFAPIIESNKLNVFDTFHQNRFQGGLSERYFSVFLNKLNKHPKIIELFHAGKPVHNSFIPPAAQMYMEKLA